MGYMISEDCKELLKDVKDFAVKQIKEQVKQYDISGEWPREIYDQAIEMQLHMMDVPEEYGGLGLDHIDQAAIVEQIAWADAGVAVTLNGNGLALKPVLIAGSEEQKRKCCDIIVNGGWGAFALTEPDAGCDAGNGKTTAIREGDSYVLNGRKCFITNASVADFFVVTAMTDKSQGTHGMSGFLIYKGTPGLSVGNHENKMGVRCSTTSDLVLDNVRIPVENRLGEEGTGFATAMKTLDGGRLGMAAQALGIAQGCLDESVKYAKERKQFGKAIIEFPAVQEILANMKAKLDAGRSLLYQTARYVDIYKALEDIARDRKLTPEERAELKKYTRLADAFTPLAKGMNSEYANQNAYDAISVHGGSGFIMEYKCQRLFRDARIFSIYEGTTQLQVVAAIRYITNGTCLAIIKEMLENAVAPELQALKERVVPMVAKLEGAIETVKAADNQCVLDFLARRLYEMTADIIMSLLILDDATRAPELFTKSANVYVRHAEAEVEGHFGFIKNFRPEDIEYYIAQQKAAEE